jgi:hypothetical protein
MSPITPHHCLRPHPKRGGVTSARPEIMNWEEYQEAVTLLYENAAGIGKVHRDVRISDAPNVVSHRRTVARGWYLYIIAGRRRGVQSWRILGSKEEELGAGLTRPQGGSCCFKPV